MVKFKIILLSVASLLFFSTAHADDSHGVMMVVKGDIKVTRAKDAKVETAKVGLKVLPGDSITAGPDSRAKIVMSDKNVLNISPDTKIVIEKYSNNGADKNVELKVEYGKIRASVEQKYDGEKSKFNVKTPSAVAGVRGTDFLTGYNAGTKQSQVITFSGTVAMGQPGPGGKILNAVFVQPGQMTTSSAGAAPEPPKAMPKEELNKMNSDSAADTSAKAAPTAASDAPAKEPAKEAKADDKKSDGERKPASASEGTGSMVSSGDVGLAAGSSPNGPIMEKAPTAAPPQMPAALPRPVTNTFLDAAKGGGKTKMNIIINKGQ